MLAAIFELESGAGDAYRAFLAEAGYRYRVARARFVERNFRHALEFASLPNLRYLLAARALRPLWGDVGRHARSGSGGAGLPLNRPVEVVADVALACLIRLQRTARPDLKLVVMSATLDPKPVSRFLGNAPILASDGRL